MAFKFLQRIKHFLADKNILSQKNFLSEPTVFWQFLDKINLTKIVMIGTSMVLLAVIAVQVLAVRPLRQQFDTATEKKSLLRQEHQDILKEEARNNLRIPDRADFPQILEQINHCFRAENISVKAIDITQPSMKKGDFYQATIKVNGEGELKQILQAVNTMQRQQEVPFLIQELDDVDGEAEIHLSVLMHSE